MSGWMLFVIVDFAAASALAFVSGLIIGRQRGHVAGFKAGLAWGQRLIGRYRDEDLTTSERRRL